MASLSAEPSAQHSFLATLFDIPETEFAALEQREAEFELLPVLPSVRPAPPRPARAPARSTRPAPPCTLPPLTFRLTASAAFAQDLQGEPMEAASILCARSSDEEYRRRHCQCAPSSPVACTRPLLVKQCGLDAQGPRDRVLQV